MYLSQTCNMFTETAPGENIGEIKDEPYVSDLGFGIGKLSVSPTPYVGSSANTVREKFSDAELLLPALDACSMIERPAARVDTAGVVIDADASVSIGLSDIFVFQHDEWKDGVAFQSSDLDSMPSNELLDMQSEGQTKLLVEKDQTYDRNDPLVSCKAYERCAAINMPDQNIESCKLSNNGRKASKISGFDLASLNILRRNRSSSSKPARSSIWGSEVQIKPDSEGRREHDLNFGSQKTRRKVRGSKGKSNKKSTSRKNNAPKSLTGRKSTGPERFISLKFKIGNKSCCIANANDNFIASGEEIPELLNTTNCKLGDNQSGDSIRDSKKVMLSDNCAPRDHGHFGRDFDISSLKSSGKFHQTTISKDGYNFGTSSDNRFSDVGTSPDSEVINSVPDATHSEKGKPGTQGSPSTSNACASPMVGSNLVLQKKTSKEGKKKNKLHQLGNSTVGKLTGEEITNSAEVVNSVGNFPGLSTLSKSRKGKKKSKPFQVGESGVGSKPIGTEITDNVSPGAPDLGGFHRLGDVSESYETTRMASTNPHLSCMGTNFSLAFEAPIASATTQICGILESSEHKSPKLSGAKGVSKVRSKISNLRSKNEKASKKKGNKNIIDDHHQSSEKVSSFAVHGGRDSLLESGKQTPFGVGESQDITKDLTGPVSTLHYSSYALMSQHTARKAWVLCDDCQKWRRIPAALADQVEDCGWTCKDNLDKEFADCSIPQEKSNSEINEELELSDGSGEEDTSDTFRKSNHNHSKVAEQSSWSLIKSNLFLHRRRKTQTIDEVMVCHCKPPSDGRMGCGAKCLNRMLNIECVRGTCPCGHLCSNQQFQKRKYSELKWFRCGKKGYGLQAVESISEGQFLIEYVGEVLDMHTHEARQREYAMKGHKHFYFMTLNGSEVIDACAKGNLGRFINHSCEPNCRTEKWMVNGEVCVGLFALRNIKKGEEVTFDYNYVRVFGAAAKKCVCGSPNCRGYIGGDPKNAEQIVQDDSDDEFKEPVMICEDREMNGDWNDIMSKCLKSGEQEAVKKTPAIKNRTKKHVGAAGISTAESVSIEKVEGVESIQVLATVEGEKLEIEGSIKKDFTVNVEQSDGNKLSGEYFCGTVSETCKVESQGLEAHLHSSPQPMDCLLSEDISRIIKSSACERPSTSATATPSESLSEPLESKRKFKLASSEVRDGPAKPNSLVKNKCSTLVPRKGIRQIKAGKEKITPELDKLNASSDKSQNMVEFSLNGHFEAVEEKLNELLDPEGGISKRKDASRGYLKLLFLTAASENSGHGEAIQSNRDLSMILDALLKTKSRTVLVDVINKNGLQMLHNILKRYRKEFTKTPILRKLLKVLEYLAIREILTLEHITGGPPRPGVESFKDSILTLTEHVDKQVHQIARSFRDRWIPKPLRRKCCVERDKGRVELHHRSVLGSSGYLSDRGGKPSEVSKPVEFQPVAAFVAVGTSTTLGVGVSPALGGSSATNGTVRKRKSRWDTPPEDYPHSRARTTLMIGDEKMSVDDDIPPGFSSSLNAPILPSNASSVVLNLQEKDMRIRQSPLSRITSYPPGDEKMGVDEDFPPGFSYPCNAPLVTNGPSAAINHHEVEIHTNQHHEDLRTRYSLAVDENMTSDKDIPPGFSSPSNALMGPSNSISHQDNTGHYQHSSPRSNYEGDERMKSADDIPPGFASSSGHAVPSGQDATAINYEKSDVHAHKDMHPQTASKMAVDDDVPRFSSPFNDPIAFPGSPSISVNSQKRKMDAGQNPWNVVCGESQLKFVACKPLAYGISYSAVQQYGVQKAEGWSTAPGVPFQPFPPLPPYGGPKGQRASFASTPPSVEGVEKSDRSSTSSSYPSNQHHRGTWSSENNPPVAHNRSEFQQGGSYNLGRKFLRQQKWNQPKVAPPWVRMRNGWGDAGASARNGVPGVVLGTEANGYRNSYS